MQKVLSPIVVVLIIALLLGGFLIYQKQFRTVSNSSKSQSISTNVTSAWKTYVNQENGFSFDYPGDWTLVDESSGDQIVRVEKRLSEASSLEPVIYHFRIYIHDPKGAASANEYIDNKLKEFQSVGTYPLSKRMNYSIAGVEGIWTQGLPSRAGTIDIFALHNGKIFQFQLEPFDSSIVGWRPAEFLSQFEKMLATFKFTD